MKRFFLFFMSMLTIAGFGLNVAAAAAYTMTLLPATGAAMID